MHPELPLMDGLQSVWNVSLIVGVIISLRPSSRRWSRVSEQQGLHNVAEMRAEIETKDRPVWAGVGLLLGCEADGEDGLEGVTAGGISSHQRWSLTNHSGHSWDLHRQPCHKVLMLKTITPPLNNQRSADTRRSFLLSQDLVWVILFLCLVSRSRYSVCV